MSNIDHSSGWHFVTPRGNVSSIREFATDFAGLLIIDHLEHLENIQAAQPLPDAVRAREAAAASAPAVPPDARNAPAVRGILEARRTLSFDSPAVIALEEAHAQLEKVMGELYNRNDEGAAAAHGSQSSGADGDAGRDDFLFR